MKKGLILLTCLMIVSVTLIASGNSEGYISLGGEYSRAIENSSVYGIDVKTELISIGGFFKANIFSPDKKIGVFDRVSFLLPTGGSIKALGTSIDYSYTDADFRSLINFIIGPVFRENINDEVSLQIGIGPTFQQLGIVTGSYSSLSYMVGLGVDATLNLITSEKSFVNFGILADYSFANFVESNGTYERNTPYSLFSLKPYLGFGFIQIK